MGENKYRLGTIEDDETGEKLEMINAIAGSYRGDRRVLITKTEIGSYWLRVITPDGNGKYRKMCMHMSRLDFSALVCSICCYLKESGIDMEKFAEECIDDESGYMFKNVDDLNEE